MKKKLKLENVTIGIITALDKENAAMKMVLSPTFPIASKTEIVYDVAEIQCVGGSRVVALTSLLAMGNNFAAIQTVNLLRDCPNIQEILMVGIAGAIPAPNDLEKHVRLGDIVVSGEKGIYQFDLGKVQTGKPFENRAIPAKPSPRLLSAVKRLITESIQGRFPWEEEIDKHAVPKSIWERPSPENDILDDGNGVIPHPVDFSRRESRPKVILGTIGSSNVLVKDVDFRNKLLSKLDNLIAIQGVEMEGSGIADSTWFSGKGFLVIRGTCDYCNQNKNDLWQNYAALM